MQVIWVEFIINPGFEAQFLEAVRDQAANSLECEEDCLVFNVCRDPDRADRILLYEIYRDAAAFDLHLATSHFRQFDALSQPMIASKTVEKLQLDRARA
ncbi:MAG: antibiotic biosynthesis monooxygenase [Nitratireductor sp.]|nr:antibiotic biosynthesis monooxygenase [Nitratireductor sp.]MCB1458077.1 antibiotic biosynthesis monooxygenase [Nitratireductor sp.]